MADTLVLLNDTLLPGNVPTLNLLAPAAVAVDAGRRLAYVVGESSGPGALVVIDLATRSYLRTIGLTGPSPACSISSSPGIVYVPATDRIYILSNFNGAVCVLDAATETAIGRVSLGPVTYPTAIAYDSANGQLYVTDAAMNRVVVINASTDTLVGNVTVGVEPFGIAFDAGNGYLYVANQGSANVTVIDGATDRVVADIELGGGITPQGIAYDPGNGRLFVAQMFSGNVSVIDDSTNRIIGSVFIGAGSVPQGITYSAAKGYIYVANWSMGGYGVGVRGSVTLIDGATNAVVGSVGVGGGPAWLASDPSTGDVLVPNGRSENVTVIRGTTSTVVANITVGTTPTGGAYDEARGRIFVSDLYGRALVTIDSATHHILRTTPLGPYGLPGPVAVNPGNGTVYVTDIGTGSVAVVDGATGVVTARIPLGSSRAYPEGIAYNPANGYLYVSSWVYDTVTVIDTATYAVVASVAVGYAPAGIALDPANGDLYVVNVFSSNVTVIDGSTNVAVANIWLNVSTVPLAIAYDSANGRLYVTQSNGAIAIIDGATNTVLGDLILGVTVYPVDIAYNSADGYLYVANGSGPNVIVIDPTIPAVLGSISVGYTPEGIIAASAHVYVANLGSGSVSFIATGAPAMYSVSFTETGLPAGRSWSVTLGGTTLASTTDTIVFSEPDGGYAFTVNPVAGYVGTPSSGSITVSGADTSRAIVFAPPAYTVTFSETGLPAGTSWSVDLAGTVHSSTTVSIAFTERNGTYTYTVSAVPGYSANPASGTVTVSGADASVPITFTATPPATYAVTFTETGLPSGTSWSVTLGGAQRSSSTSSIAFTRTNGSYSFTVTAVQGYTANPSTGSLTVDGQAVAQAIAFTAVASGPTISSFTVSPTSVALGSSVTFTVTVSGGTGPISYSYAGLPPGCFDTNAATLTCTPTETGTFAVMVTVTDAAQKYDTAPLSLTVGPADTILGLAPAVALALFAAIAVVVLVGIAWFILRSRRRRQTPPGEEPPPSPPAP